MRFPGPSADRHPSRWPVDLVCLLTQDAKRELRTFLERHLMFLALCQPGRSASSSPLT